MVRSQIPRRRSKLLISRRVVCGWCRALILRAPVSVAEVVVVEEEEEIDDDGKAEFSPPSATAEFLFFSRWKEWDEEGIGNERAGSDNSESATFSYL